MDSDEEERLRQWKEHLASQRSADYDSDDNHLGSSDRDDDGAVSNRKTAGIAKPSAPQSARYAKPPQRLNSASRVPAVAAEDLRDSLTDGTAGAGGGSESIDWTSTLMPQLRELRDENAALRATAVAHEREVRRLRLEQQAIGTLDGGGGGDGAMARVGGDLKDSKIVELAKKNRALTVIETGQARGKGEQECFLPEGSKVKWGRAEESPAWLGVTNGGYGRELE
jgi:hypothetical protein